MMFWLRLGILIGLLIWTASVSAAEIDRSTDTQGTIHITTPKSAKAADETTEKTAVKPTDDSDKSVHLDYKSRPLSRRPMNPSSTPGSPRKVRPSPYLNPPPGPITGAQSAKGVKQGTNR